MPLRTSLHLLGLQLVLLPTLRADDDFPLVPDDLKVSLFAKEPLVRNPCAITFDAKGRLCVGMGPQYRNPKPNTPGDSVWILIDDDGDGTADSRKEYATGFNSIQGLAWRGRDLYVANAPELTIARDLDGDDEADEYVRLYTDLGNLEHALHGLNFGPDGKLYMSKGNSKGLTKPPGRVAPKPFRDLWGVEAPGAPDFPEPIVYKKGEYKKNYHDPADDWGLCGGVLRCDPDGSNLEIVSRGFRNPWDICYDDEFNWLGTDNDQTMGDKIFSPFYGAHFGWGHAWAYDWKGDDHLPTAPSAGPLFEGSGTGVVYCGFERYPEKYRGVFLVNDWLRREIYIYRPKWKGAWMQSDREKFEIFAHAGGGRAMSKSSGRSFSPVDIEVGPDGAIYVSSWGRQYGLEERDGKQINEGRIYRIWPKTAPPVAGREPKRSKPVSAWSLQEVADDLAADLPVWRINAQDEMVRRGWRALQDQALKPVESARYQTWFLWFLSRVDLDDHRVDETIARLLPRRAEFHQKHQLVRVWAQRMVNQGRKKLPDSLRPLLEDANARVRHEIVLAMRRVGETRWNKDLLYLISEETDRIVYYSAWGALMDLMPREGRKALLTDDRPGVRRAALLSLLEEDALSDPEIRTMTKDADKATATIAARRMGGKVKTEIRGPRLKPGQEDPPERSIPDVVPVSVVSSIKHLPNRVYQEALLVPGTRAYTDRGYRIISLPSELEGLTFIRSSNNDADHAKGPFLKLNLRYDSTVFLADDTRSDRLPKWARGKWTTTKLALQTDDATHRVHVAELPAGEVTFGPNMEGVKGRKANYLVIIRPKLLSPPDRATTIADVLPLLGKASVEHGRSLFLSTSGAACMICHRMEGHGNVFAPDLSDIGARTDAEFIVRSILQPSAEITEGFAMQVVTSQSGPSAAGIILEETGRAVRIVQVNGEVVTVLKKDIAKRETAPTSAMPPSFGAMLRPQDVADVTAYLLSKKEKEKSPTATVAKPAAAEKLPASKPSPLSGKQWGDKKKDFHLDCHDDRLTIRLHGAEIASYYYRHPKTKRPFFAHVKTPSGLQVTRNFPPVEGKDATDHAYMHPGLSLGFANFEGVSFWHNNQGVVIHEKFMVEPTAGVTAAFAVENRYVAPDGREMCREWASYHLIPNGDGYLLTMDIRLHGEKPFWLGVREEMGLAMRVATPITVKNGGAILSASGGRNEKGTWGKVDKWWDYFGPLGGKSAGIQIMSGPGNPEIWSHSRDYGVLVANPLPVDRPPNRGKKIEIEPGEEFRLRFGVQVHEHARREGYDPAAAYTRYRETAK